MRSVVQKLLQRVFSFRSLAKNTLHTTRHSKRKIGSYKLRSILTDLDIKSRGPNKFPPVLFKATAVEMSSTLNKLFKNVKRLRTLPRCWKYATIVPVYKKGDKQLVKNYRPVSLLNIDSKVFEKCLYDPLFLHFFLSLQKPARIYPWKISSIKHAEILEKQT